MVFCKKQDNSLESDTFDFHFNFDLEKTSATSLQWIKSKQEFWENLETLLISFPNIDQYSQDTNNDILQQIYTRITRQSKSIDCSELITKPITLNTTYSFSPLQTEVFSILNNYLDFFYPFQTIEQIEELRYVYVVHALNHIFKSQNLVYKNNIKLKKDEKLIDSCRDRGLARPKVLFIVPFRNTGYHIVNTIIQLVYGEKTELCKKNGMVINYDRFNDEYTGNELKMSKRKPKPKDYEYIFRGNIDDNFQIGISISKKNITLFSDFSSSDILIASPLGLRLVTKTEDNTKDNYDFLNSIELLIIDQAEMLYAQNWDNVLHVLKHMHLKPNSMPNTNLNRVRLWNLNGLSKFYRQTILLSSHEMPELRNIFNKHFQNYSGKVRVVKTLKVGSIHNIVFPISQVFHKLQVNDHKSVFEERFQYFIKKVLPHFKQQSLSHCMIYIPSYFDFIRLRNYFKSESINFVQISEYTKSRKIDRARDIFYHGGVNFLLYSERGHVFRRMRVTGIRHLIMYQPPYWPTYFPEIINLMKNSNQNEVGGLATSMSVTVIYTKYDLLQLKYILGSEKTSELISSESSLHVITSE